MSAEFSIPQTAILGDCDRLQGTEQRPLRASGKRLGVPFSLLYRALKARENTSANGGPSTALQRVEIVGEAVSFQDTADFKARIDALATQVKDLQAHRLEVDAWIATLQAQSQDPAQTWDDPDDAESVPFNLSLPRGLKRLLDAEAKRTGLPASRLVQRLLMAALTGEGTANA